MEKKIFCDKTDNILGKWGCKEYQKRKIGKQLGKPRKKFTKYKDLEKNGENHLKNKFNYKRQNVKRNTSMDKSICKCWKCRD